jgi:hypothetical protein
MKVYKDDVATQKATSDWTTHFNVDKITYRSFIGIQRTGADKFVNHWNGYIYEFAAYGPNEVAPNADNHAATCTGAKCLTINFAQWYDESEADDADKTKNCHASCSEIGCVRDGACHKCTNDQFCHLCVDRECTTCENYTECPETACSSNAVYQWNLRGSDRSDILKDNKICE